MLSKTMQKSLNNQMTREFYSGYLYLAMSSWCDGQDLPGFANWLRVQAQEELSHAMKFFDYLNEAGGAAKLGGIDAPPASFKSLAAVFEETVKHEQLITSYINKLSTQAMKENDHATRIFLEWFVTEQVEEEASAGQVLANVKRVGNDGKGILMLDNEMAQRTFTPAAAE